jgi:5-methylcytosine-specific restriction enzyme A
MPTRPPIHRPQGWRPSSAKRPEMVEPYYASKEWRALRAQALKRDGYQCTVIEQGARCPNAAGIVHHVRERRDGGADHLDNLRSVCGIHHARLHRDR